MSDYDFYRIFEPLEFQDFARDMVQVKTGLLFESFAEGRDLGIDGRCVLQDGRTVIFQAKRLKNSNGKLLARMKEEREKLERLAQYGIRTDRYILAIADDLLPEKKSAVIQLFDPYILNPGDLITARDLNNWLSGLDSEYRAVEEKYFKLWIQNTKTLQRILFETVNSRLAEQSRIRLADAVEKAQLFVETEVYEKALDQLKRSRVLILSGEPGAGKTTLANQAALYFCARYEFESCFYASGVEDLYTARSLPGKKVIVFDDFWGSNGFDRFGNGLDVKALAAFIEDVRRSRDCILILTTREYILEQGLKQNEDFRRIVETEGLECRIEQYSRTDRLRIYFGHLRNSALTWGQVNALLKAGRQVILSSNYNPRIIELYTKTIRPEDAPQLCVEKFFQYLECPVDFWEKIYADLSQEARAVMLILAVMPLPVELKLLRDCYHQVMKDQDKELEWKEFSDVAAELEKTVIRTDLYNRVNPLITVTWQNPSVKDFILGYVRANLKQYSGILLNSCLYFSQCVEYLKLLYGMEDTDGLYGAVMERAAALIDTEAVSFYDKYAAVLSEREERDRYERNYHTLNECGELRFGRPFQLLLLYKAGSCQTLGSWFARVFQSALESMERYPESALGENIRMFPRVAVHVYEEGLHDDINRMIDVYTGSLMKNRLSLDAGAFEDRCPDLWKRYIDEHREAIGKYLRKYYQANLCLSAVKGDTVRFILWEAAYEDDCEQFGLVPDPAIEKSVKRYERWLETNEKEEDPKNGEDIRRGSRARTVEDVYSEFKESYLEEILPADVSDPEEWLMCNELSEQVQSVLLEGKDDLLWSRFMKDEQSLNFLCAYASRTGSLPDRLADSIKSVARYIEDAAGQSAGELYRLFLSLDLSVNEEGIWSEKELEACYPEFWVWKEEQVKCLTDSDVFVHCHHWYRLSNTLLSFCVFGDQLGMLPEEDRMYIYKSIWAEEEDASHSEGTCGKALLKQLIKMGKYWKSEEEELFISALYELDPHSFKAGVLHPLAKRLYRKVLTAGREDVIENLASETELLMEITLEGDVVGGSSSGEDYFKAIAVVYDFWLFDLVPDQFTDAQMELLTQNGLINRGKRRSKHGVYPVRIARLADAHLLEPLGLYRPLEKLWKDICDILEGKGDTDDE